MHFNLLSAANMPLTATKPTAMLQTKVAPLLRLAAARWAKHSSEAISPRFFRMACAN